MTAMVWLSIVPPVLTIAIAIWSKRIIPSLIVGLLAGGYLLNPSITGGFETAVDQVVATLTDRDSLQVLLFLYLFSGLIGLMKRSGGIEAFSALVGRWVRSKKSVFYVLWALVPVTFIDCGFRIVGAGSITRPLAEKNGVANERLAFMLNNTASPVVELVPIATTFVGFNVAIVSLGLANAGIDDQAAAYSMWLRAIPLQFFSIVIIAITFLTIYFDVPQDGREHAKSSPLAAHAQTHMAMNGDSRSPAIEPRLVNLVFPMLATVALSVFFFWLFGYERSSDPSWLSAIINTEPNRAMLVALTVSLLLTGFFYASQKYRVGEMTEDMISGGNAIVPTLVILALAWPLADVSQVLGLGTFIQQYVGGFLPVWSLAAVLFLASGAVTYFIGSGWGAASLIMPFAIPLAIADGASVPLCVAAVITGGTFGDVTSPVAGMTNMSSNVAHADHARYLAYAAPYNLSAAGIAAMMFLVAGFLL